MGMYEDFLNGSSASPAVASPLGSGQAPATAYGAGIPSNNARIANGGGMASGGGGGGGGYSSSGSLIILAWAILLVLLVLSHTFTFSLQE